VRVLRAAVALPAWDRVAAAAADVAVVGGDADNDRVTCESNQGSKR
jgi:hypothetical protein